MQKDFIDVGKLPGVRGREDFQCGWQNYIGNKFTNKRILDVGAGLGLSRQRLSQNNNKVTLQDIAPNLPVDITVEVCELLPGNYDIVTAFDVIEHIVNDTAFLLNLIRLASEAVFITTPNYNISHNANPFHVREYTPSELIEFARLAPVNFVCFAGSSSGDTIVELKENEFLNHGYPHHAILFNHSTNNNR